MKTLTILFYDCASPSFGTVNVWVFLARLRDSLQIGDEAVLITVVIKELAIIKSNLPIGLLYSFLTCI